MTFLTPLALALSALCIPIVLMYILKLRRRVEVVSSTLLWRRALHDQQANAPWQKLTPNLLLLLQLLAALALVLVLARPAFSSSTRFGGDLIVLVDESYGMGAQDVLPSRFAAAQSRAISIVRALPGGARTTVIGMSGQPFIAIAGSADKGAVVRAVQGLRPKLEAPNLREALSLAASLGASRRQTNLLILTSRSSGIDGIPKDMRNSVPFPVEIDRIGGSLHDLGFTTFSSEVASGHVRALARIANFGGRKAHSDLDLFVDGRLSDARTVSIKPGRERTIFWSNLDVHAQRLRVVLGTHDDLDTDNRAWSVIQPSGPKRILLVGNKDYFIEAALAVDPTVRLSYLSNLAYRSGIAPRFDLVIFDGYLPRSLPQRSLLVNPPNGRAGSMVFSGESAAGTVTAVNNPQVEGNKILQYVDLSDVHIKRVRNLKGPAWIGAVASTGSSPALLAGQNGSTSVAVIPFNLQQSDWPLRISFPIVTQNLLQFLLPGLEVGSGNLAQGQAVNFNPPPGTRQIAVSGPGGTVQTIEPPFAAYSTPSPGVYSAKAVGAYRTPRASFAANFFPSAMTHSVRGPSRLTVGGNSSPGTHVTSQPVNLAWIAALGALVVLTAEWWLAFRR